MIENLSAEELLQEITNYQKDHKELAEKALTEMGELTPPLMTVLVYNNEISNFQYLNVPIDPMFFQNKEAKTIFVEKVLPENFQIMFDRGLLPTALSMSMEASMRKGEPGKSLEEMMDAEPIDILIHSFETIENSTVEIFKMTRKELKVVNSEGDVIDEFELEKLDMNDGAAEMGGLFANILKKFYKNMA